MDPGKQKTVERCAADADGLPAGTSQASGNRRDRPSRRRTSFFLSWESEGTGGDEVAQSRGVVAFVLKYRLLDRERTEAEFQKSVAELFRSINPQASGKELLNPVESIEKMKSSLWPLQTGRQALTVVRRRAAELGYRAGLYRHSGLLGGRHGHDGGGDGA